MDNSYDILKEAVNHVGSKMVASELSISPSLVYKWCEKQGDESTTASGTANPLDRIKKIYEITQSKELINWICHQAGGFFAVNPAVSSKTIDEDIVQNIQQFIKKFSDALDVISKSYANGNAIDEQEAKSIRKAWEDLKRTGEGFVTACEDKRFS